VVEALGRGVLAVVLWVGGVVVSLVGVTYGSSSRSGAPLRNMGVHIRFFGNSRRRIRPYGASLGKARRPDSRPGRKSAHLPCRSCRRLRSFDLDWLWRLICLHLFQRPNARSRSRALKQMTRAKQRQRQDQKIAAFGSSYRGARPLMDSRPWMADGGVLCRSEPAREKPESTAGCQAPRVIVDLHREQAFQSDPT